MSRGVLIGLAVGVGALVLGGVLWVRGEASVSNGALPVPPMTPAPLPAPTATGPLPAPVLPGPAVPGLVPPESAGRAPGDPAATAPWLGLESGNAPARPVTPPVSAGRAGAPTLDDIQKRLQGLLASSQPDVREVDAVLADLQRNQGSKVVAGVDLQAVRDNLARSERIRQVAVEMQLLAAKPGPDTPAQLQTRMAEIQRLQAGMTANVSAPAGAAR